MEQSKTEKRLSVNILKNKTDVVIVLCHSKAEHKLIIALLEQYGYKDVGGLDVDVKVTFENHPNIIVYGFLPNYMAVGDNHSAMEEYRNVHAMDFIKEVNGIKGLSTKQHELLALLRIGQKINLSTSIVGNQYFTDIDGKIEYPGHHKQYKQRTGDILIEKKLARLIPDTIERRKNIEGSRMLVLTELGKTINQTINID